MIEKSYLRFITLRIMYAILFFLSGWVLGLCYFFDKIPENSTGLDVETDVVVVLTGGAMRLEEGMEAFANIRAKKILITGIGNGFTKKSLFAKVSKHEYFQQIDPEDIVLGAIASNTFENAVETKLFMDLNHFKSLRLVTSNYHMPRSLLIFKRIMPEIVIIPHPVYAKNFNKISAYASSAGLKIIVTEYNKTLWLMLYAFFEDLDDFYDHIVMKIYSLILPTLEPKDQNLAE